MTSLSNPEPSFPFLRLPADIRNIIYQYTLTLDPLKGAELWRPKNRGFTTEDARRIRPSLQLLRLSKQIHHEASYILFQYGHVCIDVGVMNSNKSADQVALATVYLKSIQRIRHVIIRIIWFRYPDWDSMPTSELRLLCDALPTFTSLQTLDIRFLGSSKYIRGDAAYKCPKTPAFGRLLQPLENFYASHPDLRFEVREEDPYWKPKPLVSYELLLELEVYNC